MELELLARMLIETINDQIKITEMSAKQYEIAGGNASAYRESSYRTLIEFIKSQLESRVK